MTENISETRFDEDLNDEALDRIDTGRFSTCSRNGVRACGYVCIL